MSTRSGRAAVALALVAVGCASTDLVAKAVSGGIAYDNVASGDVAALKFGIVGLYVARRRPDHPVGWVLLGMAVCAGLAGVTAGWATWDDPLPGRTAAAWVASWLWFPVYALPPTVLLALYPSGRAGRRRRTLVAAASLATACMALALATAADGVDDLVPRLANPVAVPVLSQAALLVGAPLMLACVLLAVVDALRRLWRGTSPEREQLALLLAALVLSICVGALPGWPTALLADLLVPLAFGIGLVRYRLFDLQLAVRRTLLYASLTVGVVAVFVGTTAALTPYLQQGPLPVAVAAALVAVGLDPVRKLLQRGVDRLVYGERSTPVRALASLGRDVVEQDGEGLVPQVLRTVAAAVRSPQVVLSDASGRVVSATGRDSGGAPMRLPLSVGGRPLGCLSVAPRTPRDGWSTADRTLLELLAVQVAVVVHADALAAELSDSRDRLLDATSVERRRLHQELHDGLGPALSGIALGLEAAEVSLPRSPERSAALLAHLRQETQTASREVRRLVEGLRPEALDREDLAGALRGLVDGLREATADRLVLHLTVTGDLRGLGPEVDAAAYRIVAEAVTNVVRHSGAANCDVLVGADGDRLVITVEDDGTGLPQQPRPGVGLSSMRRRARSLGGTWAAHARDGGGTRIEVVLPGPAAVGIEAR